MMHGIQLGRTTAGFLWPSEKRERVLLAASSSSKYGSKNVHPMQIKEKTTEPRQDPVIILMAIMMMIEVDECCGIACSKHINQQGWAPLLMFRLLPNLIHYSCRRWGFRHFESNASWPISWLGEMCKHPPARDGEAHGTALLNGLENLNKDGHQYFLVWLENLWWS